MYTQFPCGWILLHKNVNFNKHETESKIENPTNIFRVEPCALAYIRIKKKVKLWLLGGHKKKENTFLEPFILSEGNFLKICVLSQCIVNTIQWIHFLNIRTILLHIKKLLHTLFLIVFKITKSLQCILKKLPWAYLKVLENVC